MAKQDSSYEILPFPKIRRLMVDGGRMGLRKHTVHGLVEIDVTRARQAICDHKTRTGETLSFTAFVMSCLGAAVSANKHMHACRNWRGQLVCPAAGSGQAIIFRSPFQEPALAEGVFRHGIIDRGGDVR